MASPNKALNTPANGSNVDTWDVPVNANWNAIDAAFGGTTTLNVVAASGTVTLTSTQYTPPFFTPSGLLTANVNYQFPAGVGGEWSVNNITTGAFTVTFSSAGLGTTVVAPQGVHTIIQCDGTNVVAPIQSVQTGGTGVSAAAGTIYAGNTVASIFTAIQTLSGTASNVAAILANAEEVGTVAATAATGTITIYPSTQSVLYYTSSAAANWTVNLTFSAGTTLNSAMTTGDTLTVAFLVTQGATPYYNTTVQIDGSTSGVTTKWQGAAPAAGVASSINVYTYCVIKTGSGTFTVLASMVPFV